jgi:glycosyltransferase involved in cell wall biosynthesis
LEWHHHCNPIEASLNILFIGVGSPTPTFIERRVKMLKHSNVHIVLENEIVGYKVYKEINPSVLPLFDPKSVQSLALILLSVISRFKRFLNITKIYHATSELGSFKNRLFLALRYHRILELDINLIHFQWITHVERFQWLKSLIKAPLIASARGSMVTVYPLVKPGYQKALKRSFTTADWVHCVSQDIKAACISLGAEPEKCFVNYNGIDTTIFKPKKKEFNKSFRTISVGALMWRKGVHDQLLVIKELIVRGLTIQHSIIGDGYDREGLIYQANKLGIQEYVDFKGQLSEPEIIKELQGSDLYISTSAAEGLANSVLEAASCGLPVLAFDCEGMHEIIRNEETGYTVKYGDINEMTDKVQQLIEDHDTCTQFGKNARNFVVDNFQIEAQVEQMINKYQEFAGVE